jgi:hypothetical protein
MPIQWKIEALVGTVYEDIKTLRRKLAAGDYRLSKDGLLNVSMSLKDVVDFVQKLSMRPDAEGEAVMARLIIIRDHIRGFGDFQAEARKLASDTSKAAHQEAEDAMWFVRFASPPSAESGTQFSSWAAPTQPRQLN